MNVLRDFNTGHLLNLLETSCQAEDETAGLITLGDRVAFDASHIRTGPARIEFHDFKKICTGNLHKNYHHYDYYFRIRQSVYIFSSFNDLCRTTVR